MISTIILRECISALQIGKENQSTINLLSKIFKNNILIKLLQWSDSHLLKESRCLLFTLVVMQMYSKACLMQ